jgi:hypothetical protein
MDVHLFIYRFEISARLLPLVIGLVCRTMGPWKIRFEYGVNHSGVVQLHTIYVLPVSPVQVARIAMPKALNNARRVQRHFSPLLHRSRFSPERLLTPPPLTIRTIYPIETRFPSPTLIPSPTDSLSLTSDPEIDSSSKDATCLIPKPSGEVARPGRRGYTLRDVVPWDDTTYAQVQVCFAFPSNNLRSDSNL